ncbi:MAG: ATP-binding protein [Saprospiraceae bacterium]|nr:ATP-binding protein [Saprospiraceae bacterium]
MFLIERQITHKITEWMNKNKVIIIYGARQVGKSTLLTIIKNEFPDLLILNAENPTIQNTLLSMDLERIKFLFGHSKYVAIDEAQKIENIGSILKYIRDSPEIKTQLIATGSSSFELANKVTEALTGRNVKFILYPLSVAELTDARSGAWVLENLKNLIVFGLYPDIVKAETAEKIVLLENLNVDYLFQDVIQLDNLLNSTMILKLLKALAYQIGSQVSYHELGQLLGLAPQTVQKYLDLLEKSFVIFSLPSFSRNLRNEIKKSRKYYFIDTGLRNAVINDFTPFDDRRDKGALWENFCIAERLKYHQIQNQKADMYFWRTYDQAEIDLVEDINGTIKAFEFKTGIKGKKLPESFMNAYNVMSQQIISPENVFNLWSD